MASSFFVFIATYVMLFCTCHTSSEVECPCGIIEAVISDNAEIVELSRTVCNNQTSLGSDWHLQSDNFFCYLYIEFERCIGSKSCDGLSKGFFVKQSFNQRYRNHVQLLQKKNISNFIKITGLSDLKLALSLRCLWENGGCRNLFKGHLAEYSKNTWYDLLGNVLVLVSKERVSLMTSFLENVRKLGDGKAAPPPRSHKDDENFVEELATYMEDVTTSTSATTSTSTKSVFSTQKLIENPASSTYEPDTNVNDADCPSFSLRPAPAGMNSAASNGDESNQCSITDEVIVGSAFGVGVVLLIITIIAFVIYEIKYRNEQKTKKRRFKTKELAEKKLQELRRTYDDLKHQHELERKAQRKKNAKVIEEKQKIIDSNNLEIEDLQRRIAAREKANNVELNNAVKKENSEQQ